MLISLYFRGAYLMLLTILFIFLLVNVVAALYFGKQYFALKKRKAPDREFKALTASMMRADYIIIPISIILILLVYFLN
jgi:heme/copper-type cytochrome/quinol oxidase subunit 2